MPLYLRNIVTGKIETVDPDSSEFAKLKAERTDDGRFPLYEQTGAHDADPKNAASEYEVNARGEHDVPLHDVTSDGVGQSDAAVKKLGSDTDLPSGKTQAAKA